MNKKSVGKLALSALSLSVLLMLSACSDDSVNGSADDTAPGSAAGETQ